MWISFKPSEYRYFVSYDIIKVVEPIFCERCKVEGRVVRTLILIGIMSLVLTIAIDSALRSKGRVANDVWMPEFSVHLHFHPLPRYLDIHRNLRTRLDRREGAGWRADLFLECKPSDEIPLRLGTSLEDGSLCCFGFLDPSLPIVFWMYWRRCTSMWTTMLKEYVLYRRCAVNYQDTAMG